MKNREIDEILNNHYSNDYTEDDRLIKDKIHQVEYITTLKYIDKYLKKGDRILEVGAGTGIYSLGLAKIGYQVDAIELVNDNLNILKSKITSDMNINAIQGNALDLSMYEDNTFDMTLVLGPLYHLFKAEERDKVIEEAIRVTKSGGIIYYAFILSDLTMINWGFEKGNLVPNMGNMITDDYKVINREEYIFYLTYMSEIKKLMQEHDKQEVITYVATDGIGRVMSDKINEMSDEEYKHYINYHLSVCEREDLIGYSGHVLVITKKK
ncbi:MAG: class I SAM-dependent methyltransferase [Candidatus Coprovivens sp.]